MAGDRLPQLLGDPAGRLEAGVWQQHHELLATPSPVVVDATNAVVDQSGNRLQHIVASVVAEAVVDVLEVLYFPVSTKLSKVSYDKDISDVLLY